MNCYFCKKDTENISLYKHNFNCSDCMKKYDLFLVVTSYKDDQLLYFHMYVNSETHIKYHVRLHFEENFTNIACNTMDVSLPNHPVETNILKVPGFPITPQNIHDKLKMYLLFS